MPVVDDATRRIDTLGEERVFLRHLLVFVRYYLEVKQLRENDEEHSAKDEADDIAARLVEDRHLRILDESYAVLVLNFSFLKNKSSVNKISNRLTAVVAMTFPIKYKKVPKFIHSRKTIYPW